MSRISCLAVFLFVSSSSAVPTVVDLAQSIFSNCLINFRLSGCVDTKAVSWIKEVAGRNLIEITDDLVLVKKFNPQPEEERGLGDIFETFEDFLQTHDLVAKLPAILRPDGPYSMYLPRDLQTRDVTVPLATTGRSVRSKIIKRVIFPFLLGLKFNTAVLVPLALSLIALQTWKALTLGLLSLVLTGSIAIFSKFAAPKVPHYEVLHYPHHHDHIDYQHLDVAAPALHYGHPAYARRDIGSQKIAYSSYVN